MAVDPAAVHELCRATSLSQEDATLLLGETGGDVALALMLVQRTMASVPAAPASSHPAVVELRRAIDATSGSASAVQELMASIAWFDKGDRGQAVARAQAAHHPLWQEAQRAPTTGSDLLAAIDRWIQFLRGDSEPESARYERSQRKAAIAIEVSRGPDLREYLQERVSAGVLEEMDRQAAGKSLEEVALHQGHVETRLLEGYYHMPSFSWSRHPLDPELAMSLGLEEVRRRGLFPITRIEGEIIVGMLAPGDLAGLADLRRYYAPVEIRPVLLRRSDFQTLLEFCA